MASLRDLVTGNDACTADDGGAGPSNAMGALVNTLLGGTSKQHEQQRELPALQQPGWGVAGPAVPLSPEAAALAALSGPSHVQIPGLRPAHTAEASGAHALMASIAGPSSMPADWDAIFAGNGGQGHKGGLPGVPMPPGAPLLAGHPGAPPQGPLLPGAPPPAVGDHLRRFFSAAARLGPGAAAAGLQTALPPELALSLSVAERCRIRDRATILARHVFAEQGEAFADQQVGNLLASMHIRPQELPGELAHAHDAAWHDVWQQQQEGPGTAAATLAAELAAGGAAAASQQWDQIWGGGRLQAAVGPPGAAATIRPPSTGWASEFAEQQQQHLAGGTPGQWADEFQQQQHPGAAWASEFASAEASGTADQRARAAPADALASTRALVNVLSKDADPKMRASKFLQFVSKMSKGELILGDNKVLERPAQGGGASAWAEEFSQRQQQPGGAVEAATQPSDVRWADEFARQFAAGVDLGSDAQLEAAWRQQAGQGPSAATARDAWVEQFNEEADEQVFKEWERIYGLGHVEESLHGPGALAGPARHKGEYVFSADNPFRGDAQALDKGKDLFRRGVLSEAALALEAEVQAYPDNAEAWRLLGTVHAENDDDQQAIAAMLRALGANPTDMDVLLALGVSHVNELDIGEAVQHLFTWLSSHPQYRQMAGSFGGPPDSSQALSHTLRVFKEVSRQYPEDAELAVALGVLHHLGRQYSEAISAFEAALKLRPQDYSLWNKLGATLANNGRSPEAIHAYQKALDLKPNYMRAWTNMGISFANIGDYDRSARFYVRALALNPSASHVWGYLRTSLACANALDLIKHVDDQDLAALSAALPLE